MVFSLPKPQKSQKIQAKKIPNAITWETKYIYETGRKYLKVIKVDTDDDHRCVEAFIDRQTGDLYKPASWNKPAKGIRFNLLDKESCEKLFKVADPHGGHLYRR